jgi:hypothetical protein
MAIIDWPTTRPFQGASLQLDLSTSRSGFAGFYTGNRQTVSHLADRRLATLTLPPCRGADGPARQAFLHGLMSRGDWLRMGVPHQPYPRGTLGGAPTVSATVAAGARAIAVAGALARPNWLTNRSFEEDSNADGVSDGWVAYAAGSTGTVTRALLPPGSHGTKAQQVFCTALAAGAGNRIGIFQSFLFPAGVYSMASFAADIRGTAAATAVLELNWVNGSGGFISAFNTTAHPDPTNFQRLALAGVAVPAAAARADCYVWLQDGTGAACGMDVDAAQFEFAAAPSPFSGLPSLAAGDWLSIGGNLLQVDYPGATLNDGGAGTVPLVTPLQRGITAGAAVTWANPTGLWEVDADSLPLNFNPAQVADGFALPLREVFA